MRNIPQLYYDFIGRVEGDPLVAYPDSGGVLTIGKGHTGPEVVAGMRISQDESDHMCVVDSHKALVELYDAAPAAKIDALNDHQFAAILSFVFNLGADRQWTIWKDFAKDNLADVPVQLMRFDHAHVKGKLVVVPGLIHRRMAERALWGAPDIAAAGKIMDAAPVAPPPSSQTRAASTPPAPALPAVPTLQSRTKLAAGGIAILGVASAVQQMLQSSQASIDHAGFAFSWLPAFDHYSGVAIAVLGGVILVVRQLDEQLKTQ